MLKGLLSLIVIKLSVLFISHPLVYASPNSAFSVDTCYFVSSELERAKCVAIMHIARPIPKNWIFYIWGDVKKKNKLVQSGVWSDQDFNSMMESAKQDPKRGIGPRSVAGRGIYLSGNPYSSSIFGSPIYTNDPALIEVKVDAGVLYLDLTNPEIEKKVNAEGIVKEDLYKLNPPLLIKYDDEKDWWVLKTNRGVHFRPLTTYALTPEYIKTILKKMRFKSGIKVFNEDLAIAQERNYNYETLIESYERNSWSNDKVPPAYYLKYLPSSENGSSQVIVDYPQYNFRMQNHYLSDKSDANGVCRYYGYQRCISAEVETLGIWGTISSALVRINTSESIVIDKSGMPVQITPLYNLSADSAIIKNITCADKILR